MYTARAAKSLAKAANKIDAIKFEIYHEIHTVVIKGEMSMEYRYPQLPVLNDKQKKEVNTWLKKLGYKLILDKDNTNIIYISWS